MFFKKYILVVSLLTIVFTSFAQTKPKFNETEISVTIDSFKLAGTLTTPLTKGPYPLVFLIAGSGHTDRDGNQPNMETNGYKQMAEKLAEKGIAMVRYDKRGVGESLVKMQEGDLRFDNFIDDAIKWIHQLKQDKRFSKLIVAGHSEGSLIGMMACQKEKVDAYISIDGPSKSIDDILKSQLVAAVPDTFYYNLCCRYLDSLKQGITLTDPEPGLASLFRPSIQPYMMNWMKYNPVSEITKLTIPILIIQGENDIQVEVANAFDFADACPKAHVKIIKGMNHVLKTAEMDRTKNLATYSDPSLPVVQNFLDEVQTFISIIVLK